MDLAIYRLFTKELDGTSKTVYDLFNWKRVDVILKNHQTSEIITELKNLEFPDFYSQSACDIIASKYFRRKGIGCSLDYENSMKQLVHRMVLFWTTSLSDEKLIDDEQKDILYDELAYTILNQMWAPNSPQWFNTGLDLAYNIKGPAQGHYYYDIDLKEVVKSPDAYSRTQGSACFIVSVMDSLIGEKSLTDQLATETLLFKYGSGVGTNWSPIRAKDESLSGGGKSSGLLSFLKVSDKNAGAIKSGGTTRRAAKMNMLDLDHPEILEFINWKAHEEDKAKALGKMGYNTNIDGEAYDTVSGQNSNNSVRIPNNFMNLINKKSASWNVNARTDKKLNKTIDVETIWDSIAKAAHRCGDPAVQFDDTINMWHTCPLGEDGDISAKHNRINASNPCSEYMFLDDTACNLASINILKYYDFKTNVFDLEGYLHTIKIVQLVLEATIHFGQFPTKDIARKTHLFRTTGLGLTNLGALFMEMSLPYDSDESRTIAACLTSMMTGYSYLTSSYMAEKIGAFPCYDLNKEHMLKVIKNHATAANYSDTSFEDLSYKPITISHDILKKLGFDYLSTELKQIWNDCIYNGGKYGFRNAQVSVLAPTGTIAFAMDCVATSSEPFFSHVAYKKLVGGGFMEIINPCIKNALARLNYTKNQIDDIVNYILLKENNILVDGKIEGAPHLKLEHYKIFDTANKCGTGTRYIKPDGHVKMMGALTPHVSGAISKTVNLPSDATIKDIKDIYFLAWKIGVKAIALYRDGCKTSQPLSTSTNDLVSSELENLSYKDLLERVKKLEKISSVPNREKPRGIRSARVHEAAINGLKLYITTSFFEDGRLGEIYVSSGRQGSLAKGLLDSLSTTISKMLQYGVNPTDIAKMYRGQKYEPSGFVTGHPYIKSVDSISDLISKIIDIELGNFTYCQVKPIGFEETSKSIAVKEMLNKKYTANDYLYGDICHNCKSTKMVKNGTCKICTECGSTTGCS